ncbi:MAG: hypothetical protein KC503_41670 [Myxococcales bacterium]|nr:hypothetical protein [Myxococcales bacterium]
MSRIIVTLALVFVCAACSDSASNADAKSPTPDGGGDAARDSAADAPAREAGADVGAEAVPPAPDGPRPDYNAAPNPKLAGLGDGDAIDLGAFGCTSPGAGDGTCTRVTDYSGFTFDPNNHQFLMFGGGHSTTMTDSVFAFDLASSLTWKELYAPTPCSQMVASNLDPTTGAWKAGPAGPYPRPLAAHTYDLLAFAPAQNAFVLISRLFNGGYCSSVGNDVGGPVAHFDLGANTWSFSSVSAASGSNIDAAEYDPVSKKILIFGRSGLGYYDPAQRSWSLAVSTYNGDKLKTSQGADADMNALGYANHMVYLPSTDTFYYFVRGGGDVYALKLDRTDLTKSTLDRVTTSGSAPTHGEPGYAVDTQNNIIGGAVKDSMFYVFDPAGASWSAHALGGSPGTQAFHAIGYDPVNNVFIFITDGSSGAHTWAFRYKN